MVFVDTHAHLDDDQFAGDVAAVLARAQSANVGRVINIGYRPARWETTMALAARHAIVSFALGLHPHHADEWSATVRRQLRSLLETSGAVALGEIGIDLFRDGPPLAQQERVFDAQLELAAELNVPVVIHQRAAEAEVTAHLRSYAAGLPCILHSFDAGDDLGGLARERGWFVGVGGLMTRRGAADVRRVISTFSPDHLILETDSPYLVPAGVKNRRNEPANVPVIAEALSDLLRLPLAEIERRTTQNATTLFGIQAEGSSTRYTGRR